MEIYDLYKKELDKNHHAWMMLNNILYSSDIYNVDFETRNKIRKVYNILSDFPENLNIEKQGEQTCKR